MDLLADNTAVRLGAEDDARQVQRLRAMRNLATAVLLAAAGLYAIALGMRKGSTFWDFTAAFAEAALVGALADWFAVVALFRRPMGLPLWHTAVVPRSKDNIARNLGKFVENYFVSVDAVTDRLRELDPGRSLARWLCCRSNARWLGTWVACGAHQLLARIDDTALRTSFQAALMQRLSGFELQGPIAECAEQLVAEKRHHKILDGALEEAVSWLDTEPARTHITGLVDDALGVENAWLRALTRAGAERLRCSVQASLAAALHNPEHVLRQRYEQYVSDWLVRLRTDESWTAQIRGLQTGALQSPQLAACLDALWRDARAWLERDLLQSQPVVARHAAMLALACGRRLAAEPALCRWITDATMEAAKPVVRNNRGAVAAFIRSRIDAWSASEMARRIELAVGRDLQFIRLNGTLVGGLAGLLLHLFTMRA